LTRPVPGHVERPQRLRTARVEFESAGDRVPAYLARPETGGRYPALVVVHEGFGPVDHIDDVCRRFANVGLLALAPNLYHRVGAPDPTNFDDVLATTFGLPDTEAVADLAAAVDLLRADPECNGRVGVIGFCSGGRLALLLACSDAAPDAAVDCWGGFVTTANFEGERSKATRPTPPIDLVKRLGCPLYAVVGEDDANPSPAVADELRRRLTAAGKPFEVEVFEGAGHAFFADYRTDFYREGPAHELWPKLLGFFERHLGA
jgi:carboxymethylenebutenolidase